MKFFNALFNSFLIVLCVGSASLNAALDLTIVGFVKSDDGLGKVSIAITELLGEEISTNFICSRPESHVMREIPLKTAKILENPDTSQGKVALFTGVLPLCNMKFCSDHLKKSIVKIAYSMLETTRIPDSWVKILNEEFDAVAVPDPFIKSVYKDSGVHVPIFVLPIPMNLAPYFAHPMHSTSPSKPFIFMDASVNKNPGTLIKAFAIAFGNRSDVRLVARAGLIYTEMRAILNEMINKYGLTNVVILDGFVNGQQWIDLLASCDCYINLSRGEGFSFIPREALALGIPAIITDNTAVTTICASGHVRAIPCRRKGPPNPLYQVLFPGQNCGEQFDCEAEDVAEGMKDVFDHYEQYIYKAREGRKWVEQYNVANPELQELYHTLIKPKTIVLGSKNEIKHGTLTTNSLRLYQKYLLIAENWRYESVDEENSLDHRKSKWIRFKWGQQAHIPYRGDHETRSL